MKFRFTLMALLPLIITSCTGSRPSNTGDSDSVSKVNTATDTTANTATKSTNADLCFYMTEGVSNQDTTRVNLHINGNKVKGEMSWLPAEKDRRKGTLEGSINNGYITAVWNYGQEGTTDTLSVAFRLTNGQLTQKPYKYDTRTSKQQTNGAAGYTVLYKNCK